MPYLDRDIEDTRQPPENGDDTDVMRERVKDCLPHDLWEFVQGEMDDDALKRAMWHGRAKIVERELATLRERAQLVCDSFFETGGNRASASLVDAVLKLRDLLPKSPEVNND